MRFRTRKVSLVLGVALWTLSIVGATPAFASSCSWDGVNFILTVNVTAAEPVTISSTGSDPYTHSLTVTGPGTATDCTQPLDVLEMVQVTGSSGNDSVTVDLANGWFPNTTPESGSSQDEVEIDFDMLGGSDSLTVMGSAGVDQIELEATLVSGGVNPNSSVVPAGNPGDSDVDWTTGTGTDLDDDNKLDVNEWTTDLETILVSGNAGADNLDAGGGVGVAYPKPLRVEGGDGADWLRGGGVDDVVQGGGDADQIRGSNGEDFADYSDKTSPVTVDIDNSQPTIGDDGTAGENDKVYNDIENLRGGDDSDTLTGNDDSNVLEGGDDNDTLNGNNGNDRLVGGDGNDTENGEEGTDTFYQGTADDGSDELSGGSSLDSVRYGDRTVGVDVTTPDSGGGDGLDNDGGPGENDDVHGDVEKVFGGSGADTLDAAGGNDYLFGGDNPGSPDRLFGGDGNDVLEGGMGDDEERGENGNDTFNQENSVNGGDLMIGGFGNDQVRYRDAAGAYRTAGVTVTLDNQGNDGQTGEGDNVRRDVEKVYGGNGVDRMTGDAGANRFYGNGGNDDLKGLSGDDTLTGGDGNDDLDGGLGNDTLTGGDGNDSLSGGGGRDRLKGNAGGDTLNGGDGTSDFCDVGTGGTSKTNCER